MMRKRTDCNQMRYVLDCNYVRLPRTISCVILHVRHCMFCSTKSVVRSFNSVSSGPNCKSVVGAETSYSCTKNGTDVLKATRQKRIFSPGNVTRVIQENRFQFLAGWFSFPCGSSVWMNRLEEDIVTDELNVIANWSKRRLTKTNESIACVRVRWQIIQEIGGKRQIWATYDRMYVCWSASERAARECEENVFRHYVTTLLKNINEGKIRSTMIWNVSPHDYVWIHSEQFSASRGFVFERMQAQVCRIFVHAGKDVSDKLQVQRRKTRVQRVLVDTRS